MREYAPTTDRGTGIALAAVKSVGHLMNVQTAIARDWPMTTEEAAAELQEAEHHLNDIQMPTGLVSEETAMEFTEYHELILESIRSMNTVISGSSPDDLITHHDTSLIENAVERAWVFLTVIDHELSGLTGAQNDPGRLP